MCDVPEDPTGGQRATRDDGTVGAGLEGRGTGRRTIDPDIDRAVERALADPSPGSSAPRSPGTGAVPPPTAGQLRLQASVRDRQQTLDTLSRVLRERAPEALNSTERLIRAQGRLASLETQFRGVMQRSDVSPLGSRRPAVLRDADRPNALHHFDDAFDVGHQHWDDARTRMWQHVYRDARARQLLIAERTAGRVLLSESDMAAGRAPQFLDYDDAGRSRGFVSVDIDHMLPRERVPFYALRPENFHLQTAPFNRRWLNPYSRDSAFPMGRYGVSDEIEEFVQANRLSRRQRPAIERVPRRSGRTIAALTTLLTIVFAVDRMRNYAEAAARLRLQRRVRTTRERAIPPIGSGMVNVGNLAGHIERIFDHDPIEVSSTRATELRSAVLLMMRRDYRPGGQGFEDFERRFTGAVRRRDVDFLATEMLEEVGVGTFHLGGSQHVVGHIEHIDQARERVRGLLVREEEYLRRAQAAQDLHELQSEVLEEEAQALAISIEDLVSIHDASQDIAAHYRRYVHDLNEIGLHLQRAREIEVDRRVRIEQVIDDLQAQADATRRSASR